MNDRINFEASWYRNRCNDQLVEFPTAALTGFTNVTTNSPANVQNTGVELTLNTKNVDNQDFKWVSKFNIGFNRNKLLAYPDLAQSPYAQNLVVGQSLNIVRLLHYTGIDPQTGQYTFQDKNHDGLITYDQTGRTTDDSYYYDTSPKFDGGFTNDFQYKNWNLSIVLYFKKQLGVNALAGQSPAGGPSNLPAI